MRRPLVSLVAAAGFMILLAIPVSACTSARAASPPCPTTSPPNRATWPSPPTSRTRTPTRSRSWPSETAPPRNRLAKLRAVLAGDAPFGAGRMRPHPTATRWPSPSRSGATRFPQRRQRGHRPAPATDPGRVRRLGRPLYVGGKTAETADYFNAVSAPTPTCWSLYSNSVGAPPAGIPAWSWRCPSF